MGDDAPWLNDGGKYNAESREQAGKEKAHPAPAEADCGFGGAGGADSAAHPGAEQCVCHDEKPTHLGFEDIGELATQAAYLTIVEDIDASRELFGVKIPFTQTEIIYSYDVAVKAGLDFDQVEWEVNDEAKEIQVTMPEIRVLSSEVDLESFKLYHENWSHFRPLRTEEFNAAAQAMKVEAQNRAVENGLLGQCPGKCRAGDPGLYPPEL